MTLNNLTGEEQDLAGMLAYALRVTFDMTFRQPDPEVMGLVLCAVTPCVIICLELEERLNGEGCESNGSIIGQLVEVTMKDGPWPDVPMSGTP